MLPEQGQFRTDAPGLLLSDLQREHREIRQAFSDAYRALAPAPGVSFVTSPTWQLSPYEMAVFGDACLATLPALDLSYAGVVITVIRRGAGTVTVASDTGALIQGVTSDAVSASRRVVYQFDGQDWWR